jgi:hypothetical protein
MSPTARAHGPELEPKPRMRPTFDRSPVRTPKVQRSKKGSSAFPVHMAAPAPMGVPLLYEGR